jgi:alpha-tubulin suppressor-like RCC1 family protein
VTGRILACLLGVAYGAAAQAPAPGRLPIIFGEMGIVWIVEVDGTVKAWGAPAPDGSFFGDGTADGKERKTPVAIPGLSDVAGGAAARSHTLVVQRDGTVLTWGRNDGNCELGVTDDRKRLTPIRVDGVHGAVQVAANETMSAAVLADGTVRVWGSPEGGLFANGRSGRGEDCVATPVAIDGLTGVKKLALDASALVLKADGTVWGWGRNDDGQLCDGTTERRLRPVQMKGIARAVDIFVDGRHSIVVLADGTVRMCGRNVDGEMSTAPKGVKHVTPFTIPGVANAVAVASAGTPMVRLRDGTLLGWGYGMHGSLGDGFNDKVLPKPHPPSGLGPVLAHYYASNGGYAIRADGTVMGWGFFTGGPKEWALTPVALFKAKLSE